MAYILTSAKPDFNVTLSFGLTAIFKVIWKGGSLRPCFHAAVDLENVCFNAVPKHNVHVTPPNLIGRYTYFQIAKSSVGLVPVPSLK